MFSLRRIGMFIVALLALGVFAGARPVLANGMVISPVQGNYSTTFSVSVDGFNPNETIAVAARLLDGTAVGLPGATADASGHVSFTVTPQSTWHDGTVHVMATGSQITYSATFHLIHSDDTTSSLWHGQYYANTNLSGDPVLVRDDGALNFDWGDGAPAEQLPADNFSARWTTTRTFANAGNYTLVATADDGVRVWVDGQLVIDAWYDHAATTYSATVNLGAGQHTLRVEYYEHLGGALISVAIAPSTAQPWLGQYYNNTNLSGAPVLVRNDAALNFNWGDGSPSGEVAADNFSARWTSTRDVSDAGTYTVIATADDGVRVWVDDNLVIDGWYDHAATTFSANVYLGSGQHTLRVEYYEHLGGALISVDIVRAS